jgi:NAD(P)-dependent dehydrogenase (short-subunit alcohol dehydrogenase family)
MNHLDMKDQVVVITGGAQGIGYAVAQRMLRSGATVSLWDINSDQLAIAQKELSDLGTVSTVVVELTDESSVNAAADKTIQTHQRIDALINSAGITGGNAPTWELSVETWRRVIDVNLVGSLIACKSVIPQMVANGYGRIVNIASVAGKDGNPYASHYSASKAGLIGLTKSLGKELAKTGVMVNAVTPAAAKTPIFNSMTQAHIDFMLSKIPMGRFLEVDEAASMITWLSTKECSFSTGAVFDLSGGRSTY